MNAAKSQQICFVCTANICRSAFAAGYAKKRCAELKLNNIEIISAGVQAGKDYGPTPEIIDIAQEFEVELSEHRSLPLEAKALEQSRFILAMEKFHQQELELRFPQTHGRVYLLRHFAESGTKNRDITDPVGLSPDFMRVCFDDIVEAVDGLLNRLVKEGG